MFQCCMASRRGELISKEVKNKCSRMWLINSTKATTFICYPLLNSPSLSKLPSISTPFKWQLYFYLNWNVYITYSVKNEHSYDKLKQPTAIPEQEFGLQSLVLANLKWRIKKGSSVVPDEEKGLHLGYFIPLRNWPRVERSILLALK